MYEIYGPDGHFCGGFRNRIFADKYFLDCPSGSKMVLMDEETGHSGLSWNRDEYSEGECLL